MEHEGNNHNNIFGYANIEDLMQPVIVTNVENIINMEHLGLYVNNANLVTLNAFLINNKLPDNLIDLECDNNNLTVLPELPDNLEWLSCNNNKLDSLPYLPDSLQYLYCDDNNLTLFPNLNDNDILKDLHCTDNKMQGEIEFLPENLEILSFSNNQITGLPELPESLIELECSNNNLTTLPELHNTELIKLNFDNNSIVDLPDLPESLRELSCRGNPFNDESIQKLIAFYEKDTTREYTDTEINAEEELKYYNLYLSKVVKKVLKDAGDKEYINPNTKLRTDLHLSDKPVNKILNYANLQTPPPPPNTGGKTKRQKRTITGKKLQTKKTRKTKTIKKKTKRKSRKSKITRKPKK